MPVQFKLLPNVETKRRPRISDYSDDEYKAVTDGCGSISLRAKLAFLTPVTSVLEPICRRHDFRYAIGFREWHRFFADLLLGLEGFSFCLGLCIWYLFAGRIPTALKYFACIFIAPLFMLLLFPTGWVTFTRFSPSGMYLKGYLQKNVIMSRAALRKEEINPEASFGERWSAGSRAH